MTTSIVLSIVSDDRPGIVKVLSEQLANHGGNWTESSMLSLAGKFAGILLASVPDAEADACIEALSALGSGDMQVVVQRTGVPLVSEDFREFTLDLVGQDRPRIIHDITRILAAHGISVLELETHCESASMSGESLFLCHARLMVPADVSTWTVKEELEELANELMVEIKLES